MSDFNELSKESYAIAQQIKELNNKRSIITKQLLELMVDYGFDYQNNDSGQCVSITPTISPQISELPKEEKKKLLDWVYQNEPDALTIIHTRLPQIVQERGSELPVELTTDGFALKVFNRNFKRDPIPLSDIKIKPRGKTERRLKKDTWKKKESLRDKVYNLPLTSEEKLKAWGMTEEQIREERVEIWLREQSEQAEARREAKRKEEEEKKKKKYLSSQERMDRKADIIKRHFEGETKTSIAKSYNISGGYVGEIIKKYERQIIRDAIKASSKLNPKPKDDRPPMVSVTL
jgi:hypothetical protein